MNEKQTSRLKGAEADLGLGPCAMAAEMGTPYGTYKDWKSGRRAMPPVAFRCLDLLLEFYTQVPASR